MTAPDNGLYLWVTRLAARSPDWLNDAIAGWSLLGLLFLAGLLGIAAWRARGGPSAQLARVLMAPIAIAAAVAVDTLLKLLVREVRPCSVNVHSAVLEACPPAGDWSFPSNHTVVAVAAAAALWMIERRLGYAATVAAVAVGFSRVWVGVHYPHDVLAAVLVGLLVAVPVMRRAGRLEPAVNRLRAGRAGGFVLGSQPS